MERPVRHAQRAAGPPGSRRFVPPGAPPLPAPVAPASDAPPTDAAEPAGEPMGVYVISVTARILRMHPQTLRKYERLGLVRPSRSVGMVRYYSEQDLSRLRMIKYLVEERGMNLAGVELALELVGRLQGMQQALAGQRQAKAAAALEGHVRAVLQLLHYAASAPGADDDRAGRDGDVRT